MSRPVKHLFILNPKSFWHRWKMENVLAKIHGFFKETGSKDYAVHISRFPRDAAGFIVTFARTLPPETVLRVYAVGGDGILFDCLNGVMSLEQRENIELAVLPYGRTNNFIRGFGRDCKSLFRDIRRQCGSSAIPMDVISEGTIYAFNFCTIGTESLTIRHTLELHASMEESGPIGRWLVRSLYEKLYYAGSIPACLNIKTLRQHYEINVDGEDLSGSYRGINIANGSFYGGSKRPVPTAMPNDGVLDILFARSAGRLRTLRLIPFYIQGLYDRFPGDFMLRRARRISVRSKIPILMNFDDLVFYSNSCSIEVLPGAVNFVDAAGQGYRGALADD